MAGGEDIYGWVERLGGWAVVLVIVRWMMTRIDKLIDGWSEALGHFKAFEQHEVEIHRKIIETQREILDELRRMKG